MTQIFQPCFSPLVHLYYGRHTYILRIKTCNFAGNPHHIGRRIFRRIFMLHRLRVIVVHTPVSPIDITVNFSIQRQFRCIFVRNISPDSKHHVLRGVRLFSHLNNLNRAESFITVREQGYSTVTFQSGIIF